MANDYGLTQEDLLQAAANRTRLQNQMANVKSVYDRGGTSMVPYGSLAKLQAQLAAIPDPYKASYEDQKYQNYANANKPKGLNTFQKMMQYAALLSKGAQGADAMYKTSQQPNGLWQKMFGQSPGDVATTAAASYNLGGSDYMPANLTDYSSNGTWDFLNPGISDPSSMGGVADDILGGINDALGYVDWGSAMNGLSGAVDNIWNGVDDASWGWM